MTREDKKNMMITIVGIYVVMIILGILNVVTALLGITIPVIFQYFLNRTQLMGYAQFSGRKNRFLHKFPMRIGKNVEQAIIIYNCMFANLALIILSAVSAITAGILVYIFKMDNNSSLITGTIASCLVLSFREFHGAYSKIDEIQETFEDTSFKVSYLALDTVVSIMLIFRGHISQFLHTQNFMNTAMYVVLVSIALCFLLLMYMTEFSKVRSHITEHSIKLSLDRNIDKCDTFTVECNGVSETYLCNNYYPVIESDGKCRVWCRVDRSYKEADKLVQITRKQQNN